MAKEITVEEAQANLERKREQYRKENPGTPSTSSKKSTNNIAETIGIVVPGECFLHKQPYPCPVCAEEDRKEREQEEADRQRLREFYKAEKEAVIKSRMDHPENTLSMIGVGKRHLFCSFDSYRGGEKIKAVCKDFLHTPFDLVLSGTTGTGKTHLAVAILRELVRQGKITDSFPSAQRDYTGRFASVPEILAEIRSTYGGKGDEQELIDNYASLSFLVLDDLGAEKSTEWSISTLYLIIDRRHREMLPTIITTNLTLDEIAVCLSPRIASRLSAGKIITIKAPDYRARRTA